MVATAITRTFCIRRVGPERPRKTRSTNPCTGSSGTVKVSSTWNLRQRAQSCAPRLACQKWLLGPLHMPPKAAIAAVRRQLTGAFAASFCAMMSLMPASTAAVIACTPDVAKTSSLSQLLVQRPGLCRYAGCAQVVTIHSAAPMQADNCPHTRRHKSCRQPSLCSCNKLPTPWFSAAPSPASPGTCPHHFISRSCNLLRALQSCATAGPVPGDRQHTPEPVKRLSHPFSPRSSRGRLCVHASPQSLGALQ